MGGMRSGGASARGAGVVRAWAVRTRPRARLGSVTAGALAALVAAACSAPPKRDLVTNEEFYAYTEFSTDEPLDAPVFVAKLADRRNESSDTVVDASGPYPVMVFPDAIWEGSPLKMLRSLLKLELRDSRVFPEVVEQRAADAYTLSIDLTKFYSAVREQVSGGRSFAEAEFMVTLRVPGAGPKAAPLFTRRFASRQTTGWRLQATDPRLLLGRCTRDVIGQMLAYLDSRDWTEEPSVDGKAAASGVTDGAPTGLDAGAPGDRSDGEGR